MATSMHFGPDELTCRCCGRGLDLINPRLLDLLEQLRWNIGGLPLVLSCAYRCPAHNAEVGGVMGSQHVLGNAADVLLPDGLSMGEFRWYAAQLPFDGIGCYPAAEFLHLDVRAGGIGQHIYWEG